MAESLRLRVKRIYEPPSRRDGVRILVDRLWPRGVKKDECELDGWVKDVAPSDKLRRWFNHDPDRWDEFQRRYSAELDKRPDAWKPIAEQAQKKTVTLLFGARDEEHNQAVALKAYLQRKAKGRRQRA